MLACALELCVVVGIMKKTRDWAAVQNATVHSGWYCICSGSRLLFREKPELLVVTWCVALRDAAVAPHLHFGILFTSLAATGVCLCCVTLTLLPPPGPTQTRLVCQHGAAAPQRPSGFCKVCVFFPERTRVPDSGGGGGVGLGWIVSLQCHNAVIQTLIENCPNLISGLKKIKSFVTKSLQRLWLETSNKISDSSNEKSSTDVLSWFGTRCLVTSSRHVIIGKRFVDSRSGIHR